MFAKKVAAAFRLPPSVAAVGSRALRLGSHCALNGLGVLAGAIACLMSIGSVAASSINTAPVSAAGIQGLSLVSGTPRTHLTEPSYERLECVLEQLQEPYTISQIYWRRAHQELHKGRFDGLYPVTPAAAAHLGQVSAPLYVEQWYYYGDQQHPPAHPLAVTEPIGVIAGSLQESWLRSRGHQAFILANNAEQLIKLVNSRRVTAVLASANVMDGVAQAARLSRQLYRYAPVSVAFSRELSVQRSDLIDAFNRKILDCNQTRFALAREQELALVARLSVHFERWKELPELADQLRAHGAAQAKKTAAQLRDQEIQWHDDYVSGRFEWQQQYLEPSLSQRLMTAREGSAGVVNAVWVLDASGRLYASSDYFPKLDYHQSPLFVAAKDLADGEHTVGQVMYSETFRRSQVLVGIALRHPADNALLGVMAFAFDLEVGVNSLLEHSLTAD